MAMTGRTYLLGSIPVTVVTGFHARRKDLPPCPPWLSWERPPRGAPRLVAVRFPDGATVVRTFRGLRRMPAAVA